MIKSKIIFRKLNIVLFCVIVLSFSFALPCSAANINYNYNPVAEDLLATYHVADDLDYGSQSLIYEGTRIIGKLSWTAYSNVPFDIGNDGSNYTIRIEISGLAIGLENTTEPWTLSTRYAIGNGSSIFTIGDTYMFVESENGVHRQFLDLKVIGNVAYVYDQIDIPTNGDYKFIIEFNFPTTSWSDSSWLYLYRFSFERHESVQESIENQTDAIINADGDGSIHDSNSALKDSITEKDNAEKSIDDIRKELEDLPKPTYNPDSVSDLNPSFEFIGQSFTSIVLGFGIDYQNLWWILVSLGLFGSCFGVVLLIFRR